MKKDNIKEIVDNYYKNDCNGYYLLGANLKNSSIKYWEMKKLFFDPKSYKIQKLVQTNLYDKIDDISDIDLSYNDFSDSTWYFDEFFYEIFKAVKDYVELFYHSKFVEVRDAEELDDVRTYVDESYIQDLHDQINKDIAKIIHKLIPNLMNTKLKIRFKPDNNLSNMAFVDKIITDILNSGKFDGCYLDFYYNYNHNCLDKKRIEGYKEHNTKNNLYISNPSNTNDVEEKGKAYVKKV